MPLYSEDDKIPDIPRVHSGKTLTETYAPIVEKLRIMKANRKKLSFRIKKLFKNLFNKILLCHYSMKMNRFQKDQ